MVRFTPANEKYLLFGNITGSNAFLLSSDLATLFTGRTIEIRVFPFSFSEYMQYFKPSDALDVCFDNYVRIGGMSGSYVFEAEQKRFEYVKDVYDTILLRDLVQKYSIRNKAESMKTWCISNCSAADMRFILESFTKKKSTLSRKNREVAPLLPC